MKKIILTAVLLLCLVCVFIGCASQTLENAKNIAENAKSGSEIAKRERLSKNLQQDTYMVPMIMYHRIYTEKLGQYCISPEELECDLKYLKDNNYNTVTVKQLVDFKAGKFLMPQNPIVLTFDDGNYNNLTHALPLLQKYNQCATIFVIGEFSERFSKRETRYPATSYLSFADISKMKDSGLIDVQNHTYDFHDWTRGRFGVKQAENETLAEYKEALAKDVLKTQKLLKDNVGVEPVALAYPFGAYSKDTVKILQDLGFKALVTTNAGINKISRTESDDIFALKRVNRPHGKVDLDEVFAEYKSTRCLVKK